MKRNLLVAAFLASAVGAFAQGTVTFYNRATSGSPGGVVAPIYGVDSACPTCEKSGNTATNGRPIAPIPAGTQTYGGTPISGTGFTAAIWGVNSTAADAALRDPASQPLSAVPFRVSTQPSIQGFWENTVATVANVPGGGSERAKFIIRVWDNKGGTITSWSQVLADNSIARGESSIFTVNASLGLAPSITPPNLVGLESFQLHTVVPEPSVIALGVLGAGCLFLLRRRK